MTDPANPQIPFPSAPDATVTGVGGTEFTAPVRHTVRRGPVDISLWVSGPVDAPLACLLHPLGLDHRVYDEVVAKLNDRFRLVVPDLRGHGETRASAGEVRLPAMARDVLAVLDALDLLQRSGSRDLPRQAPSTPPPPPPGASGAARPVHLVGHAMGAIVAALTAASDPGRFPSLHLLASPAQGAPVFRDRAQAAVRSGMKGVLQPTLERWFTQQSLAEELPVVDYVRRCLLAMPVENWTAVWESMAEFPGYEPLAERLPRTYCISAGQDVFTPPSVLAQISHTIPSAVAHRVIPGAGHLLTLERPAALAELLGDDWEESGQPVRRSHDLA
ncbi:alpha/beta fold hydrolase [Actinoalloteichus hymeniacidonis]|uniref:Hydrolase or acyltransferase of alpha/beta superfamily n=1 Tax=Actinoalloteichus hymeniacidonis TaxID=340345 RepID=A0AAC9HS94_9PSEU|nr:alpha/beta fold hydrolase [Actinoalloteichus hymeniacidonis]AOS64672.1 putative hydrolase or acyltransferase of alpha/beta superfamily [Actinoalloteichus hymeniacidonis]MBB5907253.1 3-oxoadipate enol-lactonase [Actinoalloteichus hymeniacidonis]